MWLYIGNSSSFKVSTANLTNKFVCYLQYHLDQETICPHYQQFAMGILCLSVRQWRRICTVFFLCYPCLYSCIRTCCSVFWAFEGKCLGVIHPLYSIKFLKWIQDRFNSYCIPPYIHKGPDLSLCTHQIIFPSFLSEWKRLLLKRARIQFSHLNLFLSGILEYSLML